LSLKSSVHWPLMTKLKNKLNTVAIARIIMPQT
jgi:hypothetical protein